tara:strand:- start:244 stop:444 length:201 start_codon:yes stop_codon:yes gene_type:complete
MWHEVIHHLEDDEQLFLQFDKHNADAIYSLIMWLEGWQEDRHKIPGAWDLLMAYRSGKVVKKRDHI